MEIKCETHSFAERLKSMLKVDFRRMFTMPLVYITTGISFIIPVLILIMTTMLAGTTTDPVTGAETTVEGFTNVWQAFGSVGGAATSMDLTGMCNVNLLYFLAAVLVCVFVAEDFKSGYAKNLFAVRAKKSDYVISKTLVGFVGSAIMLVAYFAGAMIGGAIAGLSFDAGTAGAGGIAMCLLSKLFLFAVFVAIFLLAGVIGKQKLWLSLVGSLCAGMLLFAMIPMITPLDSGILNVALCFAGGAAFAAGLGAVSVVVLNKTALV